MPMDLVGDAFFPPNAAVTMGFRLCMLKVSLRSNCEPRAVCLSLCRAQRSCRTKDRWQSGKSQWYICLGLSDAVSIVSQIHCIITHVWDACMHTCHGTTHDSTGGGRDVQRASSSFRSPRAGTQTSCRGPFCFSASSWSHCRRRPRRPRRRFCLGGARVPLRCQATQA
jgi:hypothetical protein